jgi:hypothetical protein
MLINLTKHMKSCNETHEQPGQGWATKGKARRVGKRGTQTHVNCACERSQIPSHESYVVESFTLKGKNSKEKDVFPDGWTLETNTHITLLCTVNISPLQASPFYVS